MQAAPAPAPNPPLPVTRYSRHNISGVRMVMRRVSVTVRVCSSSPPLPPRRLGDRQMNACWVSLHGVRGRVDREYRSSNRCRRMYDPRRYKAARICRRAQRRPLQIIQRVVPSASLGAQPAYSVIEPIGVAELTGSTRAGVVKLQADVGGVVAVSRLERVRSRHCTERADVQAPRRPALSSASHSRAGTRSRPRFQVDTGGRGVR